MLWGIPRTIWRRCCALPTLSVGIRDVYKRQGPDGGLVMIDDTTVLERALKILDEMAGKTEEAVRA